MRVGFATQILDVPEGSPMGGYAFREGTSQATLDGLSVSAITWYDGDRRAVVALVDVICVNADLTRAVRAAVSDADVLWLAASHTHAGPETGCVPGGTSTPEPWLERITETVAETTNQAIRTETEAYGLLRSGSVPGVGAVRSRVAGEPHVPLDVVEVVGADGYRVGVIVVLPVHPTVLPPENLLVSADLTGAVRRALADRIGPATWVAVATGAAGDISTRRTRQGQDAAELDRLGGLVADRCVDLLARPPTGEWSAGSKLAWRGRTLTLAPKPPVDGDALIAAAADAVRAAADPVAVRIAEGNLDGARIAAASVSGTRIRIEAEVGVLRIGRLTLVALPGEPFLDLAEGLRTTNTVVLGYANAYPGYLPTAAAYEAATYEAATYEVLAAAAAAGSGEEIARIAAELMTTLEEPA